MPWIIKLEPTDADRAEGHLRPRFAEPESGRIGMRPSGEEPSYFRPEFVKHAGMLVYITDCATTCCRDKALRLPLHRRAEATALVEVFNEHGQHAQVCYDPPRPLSWAARLFRSWLNVKAPACGHAPARPVRPATQPS